MATPNIAPDNTSVKISNRRRRAIVSFAISAALLLTILDVLLGRPHVGAFLDPAGYSRLKYAHESAGYWLLIIVDFFVNFGIMAWFFNSINVLRSAIRERTGFFPLALALGGILASAITYLIWFFVGGFMIAFAY